MKLKKLMDENGLINAKVAKLTGYDESTISLLVRGKYNGDTAKLEADIISKLAEHGYKMQDGSRLTVRPDIFIMTENVKRLNSLCDELIDPAGDLTSSFGIIIGRAGRGKSKASLHYAVNNPNAVYAIYIDGMTLPSVARKIAYEFSGLKPHTFEGCLEIIGKETASRRRLVIIDEADKMPKKSIEMLRGVNEQCRCPIVLVGEETLTNTVSQERRLKSRVRQTVIFDEVTVPDVSAFYRMAVRLELDAECARALWKRSEGDFRIVVRDALSIIRVMNASKLQTLTMDVVKAL
jgi:DNA transposition AAA+ family ATPase